MARGRLLPLRDHGPEPAGTPEARAISALITERRSERRSELDTNVGQILNRHPAVGLAVGTICNGRLRFFHGHGHADIASDTPIAEDTVFRMGSLTKTFTAIAVMQLWEQGLLDLDAAANDYRNAYKLIPAHPTHRPATVRHLVTYTAGPPRCVHLSRAFEPILGEMVKFGRPVHTARHGANRSRPIRKTMRRRQP